MASFLAEELEQLRHRLSGDRWQRDHEWAKLAEDVSEMAALAVHLLERIEAAAARKQPAAGGWDEAAAREFVPLFRQWFDYATTVNDVRRATKEHGFDVEGAEEFLRAMNRAKVMALDFEPLTESLKRVGRGESRGRPLQEVMDELPGHPGAGGGG